MKMHLIKYLPKEMHIGDNMCCSPLCYYRSLGGILNLVYLLCENIIFLLKRDDLWPTTFHVNNNRFIMMMMMMILIIIIIIIIITSRTINFRQNSKKAI